jgi:hypothetical protein
MRISTAMRHSSSNLETLDAAKVLALALKKLTT